MIESNADRLAFFNLQEFAVNSKLTANSTGEEFYVDGIFDNQYLNIDLGGTGTVSTSDLQFMCRTVDVVEISQGDTLELNDVVYEIRDIQNDGTGITILKLHKV